MMTTITADSAARDRLPALARHHHRVLADEPAAVSDAAEPRVCWERGSEGHARGAATDPSGDAASEFPGYAELTVHGPVR